AHAVHVGEHVFGNDQLAALAVVAHVVNAFVAVAEGIAGDVDVLVTVAEHESITPYAVDDVVVNPEIAGAIGHVDGLEFSAVGVEVDGIKRVAGDLDVTGPTTVVVINS